MNARAKASTVAALALAVLSGRVVDRTTGQPLPHVAIAVGSARAVTDADGHYTMRRVVAGRATATLQSDDVPAQRFSITVAAPLTHRDFRACSTTLDYGCGAPQAPGSAGSSAG